VTPRGFGLRSQVLGPLPIINRFLERLRVDRLLELAVDADPRSRIPPGQTLGVVLRSLIESRLPVYALTEWVAARAPAVLGLPGTAPVLTDDRVGRALERLFDADRAQLQTELVLDAIRSFSIECSEFHNDSTTITFSGGYHDATGERQRGQATAAITHGHNKDHRDDLKQLLWILTVSADGAVPVHYRVADGNTADAQTHRQTWDILRGLAERSDFLYVADSKLCTRENMGHIAGNGGRFLTVLPRTRKEDGHFREWVQSHSPEWVLVRQGPGRDGTPDHYLMAEAPWPSSEGYRVAWVLSLSKARRDAQTRQARILKASRQLEELRDRLNGPKSRIRTKAGADREVRAILGTTETTRFFTVDLAEISEPRFRQVRRGRPGTTTQYRRQDHFSVRLTWQVRDDEVVTAAKSDGMFPLITNCHDLTLAELLDRYKYQPCLERRHEQLKSGLLVAPMWLKNATRIEALLFLFFAALLIRALIEREIRDRMKQEDLKTLPIYPEERDCPAPTAERILDIFATVQRHELLDPSGQVVQTFEAELTGTQRRVLRLLGMTPSIYGRPSG